MTSYGKPATDLQFCLLFKSITVVSVCTVRSGASEESAPANVGGAAPASAQELQIEEWKTELARVWMHTNSLGLSIVLPCACHLYR